MNPEDERKRYRPDEIRLLFVGESPPVGGTFFYAGTSNLARFTRDAFCDAYSIESMDMPRFLNAFKQASCYLDDLCLEPVNHLAADDPRRVAAHQTGVKPLSRRMSEISATLRAIVPVVIAIKRHVRSAADAAGLLHLVKPALPFPVPNRHDARYVNELSALIGELRTQGILPPHRS